MKQGGIQNFMSGLFRE